MSGRAGHTDFTGTGQRQPVANLLQQFPLDQLAASLTPDIDAGWANPVRKAQRNRTYAKSIPIYRGRRHHCDMVSDSRTVHPYSSTGGNHAEISL